MSEERIIRRAFTLVELLVVIGILAVLVALLLPAMGKMAAMSRKIRCFSNLQQIGLGFALYRSDSGGFLPPVNSGSGYNAAGTAKSYGMWNAIGPYTGQKEWGGLKTPVQNAQGYLKFDSYWGSLKTTIRKTVWYCPEMGEDPNMIPWQAGYGESVYCQKPAGWGAANPRAWSKPRPLSAIPQPSTKIHVSDCGDWHLGSLTSVGQVTNPTSTTFYTFDIYRHDKGCNILFIDGHVAYYKGAEIIKSITRDPLSTTSMENFNLR